MELLIVDDEESALLAVTRGVHWEKLDFTAIYTALDIAEAKELLVNHEISVLLCDIEMPMGSGLELLEWVNDNEICVSCIFMTCHADFGYAQQALHMGSFEYILKPVDFMHLEEVLKTAALESISRRQLKRERAYWEKGRMAVKKQFWRDLFVGDIAVNERSIRSYLSANDLEIPVHGQFLPVLVSPKWRREEKTAEDQKLMGYALRKVAEEVFRLEFTISDVEAMLQEKVIVILQMKEGVELSARSGQIRKCCEIIQSMGEQHLHVQVCCYVGEWGTVCDIPNQIEMLQKLDFNNIVWYKTILFADQRKEFPQGFKYKDFFSGQYRKSQGSDMKILEEVRQILLSHRTEIPMDEEFIEQFFMGFYYMLNDFSRKNNVFLGEVVEERENRRLILKAGNSVEDLLEWIQYIEDVIQFLEKPGEAGENPVDKVREYVRGHLKEECSVEKIAGQVHLNPDYLNRIFKKETGMSLSQYVITQKMERAKWLLRHTDWQIGEVAVAVGYLNYSSFNKSFRKAVGQSPQDYKMFH